MSARALENQNTGRYFNRELSWLEFNRRVLFEAQRPDNPLLERLKFAAIFESNLDEFYMVRVSGLIEQYEAQVTVKTPDGLTPAAQLTLIHETALPLRDSLSQTWVELQKELANEGIHIVTMADLNEDERGQLREYFMREVFPVSTPMLLTHASAMPFISNRSLNLAVELRDGLERKIARVKVPTSSPRFVRIAPKVDRFVFLEDLIADNVDLLFPGVTIAGVHAFRVIRDADIEIRELEAADLVSSIEETIRQRRFGDPVLLEHNPEMPVPVRDVLKKLLILEDDDTFCIDGRLGFESLWEIANLERPDLRFKRHKPVANSKHSDSEALLASMRRGEVLLHHPYDSFEAVETFVRTAERDPKVIGIKQTLYRVGKESPIVESLLSAAEAGKQVAVMVELKARFDESNNLVWARALERAGAHVAYGFAELKTHCKLCLMVRREEGGIKLYAHIGTGNYNPSTARMYTDLGLFTMDSACTMDLLQLFNMLTGFSKQTEYKKLLVAPHNLREGIIERIYREIDAHKAGRPAKIQFKLNSLVDPEVIDALYDASEAGVEVDLIVRGICCLQPGIPSQSETIRVVSIVGRFLEHSRIYTFQNGGKPEAFIGSADLMRRNLDRRVEVLAPVSDGNHIKQLSAIIDLCMRDNQNAWKLLPDGKYQRILPGKNEASFCAQSYLIKHPMGLKK